MSNLLRWWLMFCLSTLAGFLAYYFGWFTELYNSDVTNLSFFILVLYFIASLFVGTLTVKAKRGNITTSVENVGWFLAESMLVLGMIGTVAGFIIMLGNSFAELDVSDTETVKTVLSSMALGMSTALYTTLVGLCCNLALKVQLVNLETRK